VTNGDVPMSCSAFLASRSATAIATAMTAATNSPAVFISHNVELMCDDATLTCARKLAVKPA